MASFSDFPLSPQTLDGLRAVGYDAPLPIQERVLPAALEGRDIIGASQTGSGKTAAFLIPMMEALLEMQPAQRFRPRALAVCPTRELARQVHEHFQALAQFTRLRSALITGGEDIHPQDAALQQGAELLVATPGRLLEHLRRGGLRLTQVDLFVIDEADRLLDEGFMPEMEQLIDHLPDRRQTMLFSATMPPEMDQLARQILFRPERLQIGEMEVPSRIEETQWPVPDHQKTELLGRILPEQKALEKVMVFVRTRKRARSLTPVLRDLTGLPTAELHAELTQAERNAALDAFRRGELRCLVTTDVASRGLDIAHVTHVINYDVPNAPDDYIHRVGRTGRVDRTGVAITLVSPRELPAMAIIEEATRRRIPTRRLPGFPYDIREEDEPDFLMTRASRAVSTAKELRRREFHDPNAPRQNPFTKTGELRSELRDAQDNESNRPRRNYKKRLEKRLKNKKLPHQRKRK